MKIALRCARGGWHATQSNLPNLAHAATVKEGNSVGAQTLKADTKSLGKNLRAFRSALMKRYPVGEIQRLVEFGDPIALQNQLSHEIQRDVALADGLWDVKSILEVLLRQPEYLRALRLDQAEARHKVHFEASSIARVRVLQRIFELLAVRPLCVVLEPFSAGDTSGAMSGVSRMWLSLDIDPAIFANSLNSIPLRFLEDHGLSRAINYYAISEEPEVLWPREIIALNIRFLRRVVPRLSFHSWKLALMSS